MRLLTNCWLVAMWIWIAGWCRGYAYVRRSYSFRGLLPHFGTAASVGWRYLRAIEYVPPKRQLWTDKNILFLFSGHYRVWHFRVMSVRRWATREQAMADYYHGDGKIHDHI